jgi:hypothetical protein
MQQQLLSEQIQVIGPMGDCRIDHQRAKIKKINPVSKIGSPHSHVP